MPNDQVTVKLEPVAMDYFPSIMGSFSGTIASHLPRVWLNRSIYHRNPLNVLLDSAKYWHTGILLNLTRGFSVFTLQALSKNAVNHYYSPTSPTGHFASLLAPATMGTLVATMVETIFIRKTTRQSGIALPAHIPLTRFSAPLSSCYFMREMGFSLAVLGSKDLPSTLYYPAFVGTAFLTSIFHRYATLEATADMSTGNPDFKRDGVFTTIRNIARGGVYTNETLRVPITNPVTNLDYTRNFLTVSCSPTTFLFRLIHLSIFTGAYQYGLKSAPELKRKFLLFQEPVNKTPPPPSADVAIEKEKQDSIDFTRRSL